MEHQVSYFKYFQRTLLVIWLLGVFVTASSMVGTVPKARVNPFEWYFPWEALWFFGLSAFLGWCAAKEHTRGQQ
jgi:hypothetical protein